VSRFLPELPGLLSADEVAATAASIVAAQEPDGAIPWVLDGEVDAWDHVECAMALTVADRCEEARAAYRWLARTQRADGSWPSRSRHGVAVDASAETNHCGYLAVGLWHYLQVTGDRAFVRSMWPVARRALDCAADLQTARGEIYWSRDAGGTVNADALLTGCSSIHQGLRFGVELSRTLGEERPDWELAAGLLGHVVAEHPEAFLPKERFAMDWYYPVLGGVLRGPDGSERLDSRWGEFVLAGYGVRCVSDRPWVTGAETCELALALDTVGRREEAVTMVADMQHLRCPDGSYWTGLVLPEDVHWPAEQSTWTAAAVILAADALCGATAGSGVFRAEQLPAPLRLVPDGCTCTVADSRS
jgi:hypothetical protein